MNKYRLELELDIWSDDRKKVIAKIADRLEEVQKHLKRFSLEDAEYILSVLEPGSPPTGGITGGPPPTLVTMGWKCVYRFMMPKD